MTKVFLKSSYFHSWHTSETHLIFILVDEPSAVGMNRCRKGKGRWEFGERRGEQTGNRGGLCGQEGRKEVSARVICSSAGHLVGHRAEMAL